MNGATTFSSWEHLGVAYVAAEAAPLLSTRRQLHAWEAGGAIPSDIERAVREAAQHGHDRSGRFRSAAEWVTTGVASSPTALPFLAAPGLADAGEGWADWEPIATANPGSNIIVVREPVLAGAGLALAVLLAALAWRGRRWPRRRRAALLFAWLALAGLALWWLPGGLRALAWYPALCGGAVALVAYLQSVSRRQRMAQPVGAAAAVMIAALALFPGFAQAPAGFTVLLVPSMDEATQTVLVPPNLVQLLDTIASKGVVGLRAPVLLGAQYEATVNAAGTADFRAEYRLYCFGDEPASLALPLSNLGSNDPLQLKEALVDGTPAFPEAARPPREGYLLKDIKGKGIHIAVLRFSVPTGTGEERAVRLSVPEVVQSRLTLETPAGSRVSVRGHGARQAKRVARHAGNGARRQAAETRRRPGPLARSARALARGRPRAQAPPADREGSLPLETAPDQPAACSRSINSRSTRARPRRSTSTFRNPSTSAASASAGSPRTAPARPCPGLRDWTLHPGKPGRLRLQFYRPIAKGRAGVARVRAAAVAGAAGGAAVARAARRARRRGLPRLPDRRPRGPGCRSSLRQWPRLPGVHARLGRSRHARPGHRSCLLIPAHRRRTALRASEPVGPGSSASNAGSASPGMCIHASQADLAVVAHFRAAGRPISFIEWDIPEAVKDIDVAGADVRAWSRTGLALQIWLNRPCTRPTFASPAGSRSKRRRGANCRRRPRRGSASGPSTCSAPPPRPTSTQGRRRYRPAYRGQP